jgi:hypothetical protein
MEPVNGLLPSGLSNGGLNLRHLLGVQSRRFYGGFLLDGRTARQFELVSKVEKVLWRIAI